MTAQNAQEQAILLEARNGVAWLTINRPPLNILDFQTLGEFYAAVEPIGRDPGIGALVIKGAGEKAFSAGVDIKDHTQEKAPATLRKFHQLILFLHQLPITTVAMVQGVALGGGCELAMVCDLVIAEGGAKFGQPEINVGCFPPVAAAFLPGLVGSKRAYEMIALGKSITAHQAHQFGLVNQVVSSSDLERTVEEWCAGIVEKSRAVVGLAKHSMSSFTEANFARALEKAEQIYLEKLMKTEDAIEGVEAFLEKRKPVWKGR